MPNSCPAWRNYQSAWNIHYRLFFLYTLPSKITFKFNCVIFYRNFKLNILICSQKIVNSAFTGEIKIPDVSIFCLTEPNAHWWAYRIGRPLSSVRRPHTLNIFSSETTGPIKVKFHMELLWDGGTKVYSNSSGRMTKMAAMPIYSKNLKKSSLEPKGRWPWNLVCSIRCLSTTKFFQMMTLGWPWPILWQGQIWSLTHLYEKKVKQCIFRNYCCLWFETSNRWQKWQEVSVDIITSVCPLPWAVYMY